MEITKMRMPTDREYLRLCDITNSDNAKMHWLGMYSITDRAAYGNNSATDRIFDGVTYPSNWLIGFRPAFNVPDINNLPPDVREGKVPVVLTTSRARLCGGDKKERL